jgi:MinD superfamily P-loop ATPase
MKADYYDCDVEEPNGFIFLKPDHISAHDALVDYPVIDNTKCTLCGECARSCQYNALANTKKSVMLFPTLCHGCHACEIVCAPKAISYAQRPIGALETGSKEDITCVRGIMNVGEHMAVPVIRQLLKRLDLSKNNILDCGPGTSCNVVNTLRKADAAVIVTEPTTFGLHDMSIAVDLLWQMHIPFGVVINKEVEKDTRIQSFCAINKIDIFGVIPYARIAAEAYSRGKFLYELPEFSSAFMKIAERIEEVFAWN